MLFHKKPAMRQPPPGFGIEDIRLESSICTGEKTIGFYDRASGRLLRAEWVRTDADIDAFYRAYGWPPPSVRPPAPLR